MRRFVALAVTVVLLASCGGGGDDDSSDAVAAKACADVRSLGSVTADTADDVRAIAARDGVPDDLRTALDQLAGLIGGDGTKAGEAQQVMTDLRDLCAGYGTDFSDG